jgi:MFS family permease
MKNDSMPLQNAGEPAAATMPKQALIMLAALCSGFMLSQAYRTAAAMMASHLQAEFRLSPQQLGSYAGAFHFAFGALQLFMGAGLDVYGIRRTLLAVFPLTVAGALLSATAGSYAAVVCGQLLLGTGCAPAFLACTVFITRYFPPTRFAAISGTVMSVGGCGMLLTATPLAWVVQESSWRTGFFLLAAWSALAWLAIFFLVREQAQTGRRTGGAVREALAAIRGFGALLAMPHTVGIVALASVTYASFMTLRGLWLGPLLVDRYGYTLVESGNVALLVSVVSLFGAPLFGRLDPGSARRRRWIVGFTLAMAAVFAIMAWLQAAIVVLSGALLVAFLSGYVVLQYADVRSSYPAELTGRAMAALTMGMFLGIALMQWLTGVAASAGSALGLDAYVAALSAIVALLGTGTLAFALLPAPKR